MAHDVCRDRWGTSQENLAAGWKALSIRDAGQLTGRVAGAVEDETGGRVLVGCLDGGEAPSGEGHTVRVMEILAEVDDVFRRVDGKSRERDAKLCAIGQLG